MNQTFSIGSIFKEARELLKTRFWSVAGQYFLFTFVIGIFSFFLLGDSGMLASFLITFIVVRWTLGYVKNGSFSVNDFFEGVTFKQFIFYLCGTGLVILSVLGGMLLLLIPGIVFAVRLSMVRFIMAEREILPMEALRKSKELTKGNRWKLFWFFVLCMLINLLGALLLVVGLVYTLPLTTLALGLVYKKLSSAQATA